MLISRSRTTGLIAGLAMAGLAALSACGSPSTGEAAPPPDVPASSTQSSAAPSPSNTPSSNTPSSDPTPSYSPSSQSPKPGPSETTKPAPEKPVALYSKGDKGDKVRELQSRLKQLDWYEGNVTGTYAETTTAAVSGFQQKRKIGKTGEVDRGTWTSLVTMTRTPTDDEMHNRLTPGPAIMKQGADGDRVRELQVRLKQLGWFSGNITGTYGNVTASNVEGFQDKRAIPVTGEVDQRTWNRLTAITRTPTKDEKNNVQAKPPAKPAAKDLDSRCMTGRALCISKSTNQLVWVIDGVPQIRVDVRFGSQELPTRDGAFSVGWKSRNHVSTIYNTPMPFAMFFSGGQAVHYSPDFAARGYNGASHGCVNVRDRGAVETLFNTVRVGDKVIVYR